MNQIIVFITCANKKEAELISLNLVKHKLAACVNILGKVKSFFSIQLPVFMPKTVTGAGINHRFNVKVHSIRFVPSTSSGQA